MTYRNLYHYRDGKNTPYSHYFISEYFFKLEDALTYAQQYPDYKDGYIKTVALPDNFVMNDYVIDHDGRITYR